MYPPNFTCMEAIETWLNGSREYHSGVQLYLEHGKNGLLKKMFTEEVYSDFKQTQLEKGLAALITSNSPPQPTVQKLETSAPVEPIQVTDAGIEALQKAIYRSGWRDPALMDEYELKLHDQWRPLYAEMCDLQARLEEVARQGLKDPTKKDEAGRMALRIIDLDKQCDKIYEQRDYYIQHGKPMEEGHYNKPLDVSLDPKQWPLKLQNHQRYLREYKGKLEKEIDPEKKEKLEQNISHQEVMVGKYKELLNLD